MSDLPSIDELERDFSSSTLEGADSAVFGETPGGTGVVASEHAADGDDVEVSSSAATDDDPYGSGEGFGAEDENLNGIRKRRLEQYKRNRAEMTEAVISDSGDGADRGGGGEKDESSGWKAAAAADAAATTTAAVAPAAEVAAAVAAANAHKEEGNAAFARGDFSAAEVAYSAAVRSQPRNAGAGESENVLAVYYGNRAAARLSLGALEGALWDCDRALELRPAYSKVVARRATVLEKLGLIDEAMKDAQVVASEASSSGAARSAAAQTVARLEAAIKDRDEKLKVCVVGFYPAHSCRLRQLTLFLPPFPAE
jgi:tetratricopeptide (TPR) repeat protein